MRMEVGRAGLAVALLAVTATLAVGVTNPPPAAGGAAVAPAVTHAAPVATNAISVATNGVPVPALWFPVGETLVYRVYWGVVYVGYTEITTEWVEVDGRRLLLIRYRSLSNSVLAKLYPVDDIIESLIDPATFLPVSFMKDMKEGRHRSHEVTTFDYRTLTARWESKIKQKIKTFALERDTRDLVSFIYHFRTRTFQPGQQAQYRVMADEKIYDLFVKATAFEPVKLRRYGKVDSMRLDPEAAFNGLFVRKGRMIVWVSRDPRCLCTKIEAVLPFANARVLLDEVRGPGDDFWVQGKTK